jgi:hypothetical protein
MQLKLFAVKLIAAFLFLSVGTIHSPRALVSPHALVVVAVRLGCSAYADP